MGTSLTAWWHRSPGWRKAVAVVIAAVAVVWLLLLVTAATASAHSRAYNARHATKVVTATVGRHGLAAADAGGSCSGATGVKGNVTVKNTIYLRGTPFLLGWIKVNQEFWCWNSTRILGWGTVHRDSYHRPGYCWDGLDTVDQWWSPWWERKASTSGSFGVPTHLFGCLGVNSASAKLYYAGDASHPGTFNFGG